MYQESDIYDPARDFQEMQIAVGTVGWEGDEAIVDLGTEENDGFTFLKVQLYHGLRTPGTPKSDVAQGLQALCAISSGINRIPKRGTRVYVAFPKGMEMVPGAGVVFATVERSARLQQFAEDRVVMDFGDDVHVVIKGKSVSLSDHDNRFLSVGTPRSGGAPGLIFQAADGSGGVIQEGAVGWFVAQDGDAKVVLQMTPTKAECLLKGGGYWSVVPDGFSAFGSTATLRAGAVYLGASPTAANTALYGPSSVAGLPSTSVFISP